MVTRLRGRHFHFDITPFQQCIFDNKNIDGIFEGMSFNFLCDLWKFDILLSGNRTKLLEIS